MRLQLIEMKESLLDFLDNYHTVEIPVQKIQVEVFAKSFHFGYFDKYFSLTFMYLKLYNMPVIPSLNYCGKCLHTSFDRIIKCDYSVRHLTFS